MWDLGLDVSDCDFVDYHDAFLAASGSRKNQKTLKKKLQEAKLEYHDAWQITGMIKKLV